MEFDGNKLRVGWRVRSLLHGWGDVVKIDEPLHGNCSPAVKNAGRIQVDFGIGDIRRFGLDGRMSIYDHAPCLVEMAPPKEWEAPPLPMLIKGWVALMHHRLLDSGYSVVGLYETKEQAEKAQYFGLHILAIAPVEFVVPPEKTRKEGGR